MTHFLIISGTQDGGVLPKEIDLSPVINISSIGNVLLNYVGTNELNITRVTNSQSFGAPDLQHVTVRTISVTQVVNSNTINPLNILAVAFAPDNAETTALLSAFDQSYTTTSKRQMDTLISGLKSAGVWAKLDWYGNAFWALSEHDALLNWVNPAQTLVKVGTASWTLGEGLKGVNPVISNSRYKSGWNIGSGPHSSGTNFAFFSKITAISVPQNSMQPMGVWELDRSGGPVTPNGAFLSMSIVSNTGFAGAALASGNGNTSFTPGSGLGVWGVSHNGGSAITVKDGVTLETDSVSGTSSYTDADGMSVAGSAGSAKKSFPGTQLYWGWSAALSAVEFAALESKFADAQLPPSVEIPEVLVNTAWSAIDKSTNVTLSLTNTKATATATSDKGVRAVDGKRTGKYYIEYVFGTTSAIGADTSAGLASPGADLGIVGSVAARGLSVIANGHIFFNGAQVSAIDTFVAGDVVSLAVDCDAKLAWFRVRGRAWNATGTGTTNDPATGVGGIDLSAIAGLGFWPLATVQNSGDFITANFGDSAFAFTVPSGYTGGWLQSSKHELRVDPGVIKTAQFSSTSSGTIALNTQKDNTLIVLNFYCEKVTTGQTVSSVSDTSGLTWTRRGQYQVHSFTENTIETWWAIAPTPITGATITVTLNASTDDAAYATTGFVGVDTSAPFDTNAGLPVKAHGTTTQATSTLSTDGAEGIVFGIFGSESNVNPVPEGVSGTPTLATRRNTGGSEFAALSVAGRYHTSALSSGTLAFATMASHTWVIMSDGIVKGP